jgi:hypothetical protein
MTIRRIAALLLLCAPAACAPIVTHGPRPQRGLALTATGGIPYPLCEGRCETILFNQIGLGARYGRPAENGMPGYSIGGTLSMGVISSEVDVYVHAPTSPEWDVGAGVLVAPSHVMPYVQLGQMRANGSGVYTTHGFVWMSERSDAIWMDAEPSFDVTPRYVSSTLAYRLAQPGGGALHVYLSGSLGTMGIRNVYRGYGERFNEPPPPKTAPVRFIMAGVSLEQRIRR